MLGVAKTATEKELKKAYRTLARKHHPDVNPGDAGAEERFKTLSSAWDVLGDPEKRKLYDEFGADASRAGFDPEQARAHTRWQEQSRWRPGQQRARSADENEQMYESLFGRRNRAPRRGRDIQADLVTDFRTAALGGVRSLLLGSGEPVDVRIPPGVADGGSIRIHGKGQPGQLGGPPGDLLITLRVEADPQFRRDGLDLHVDLPVTIVEAIRGAKVEVPTLEGRIVMTVSPHAQSGQVLRIRDRGIHRKDKAPGHLYAHLVVVAPDGDVDDDVLEKLAAAYTTPVRDSAPEATS